MALSGRDKLLLATLVPLFVVCLGLHVREIVRTGIVQPPVFAVPATGSDGYPVVGGWRLERGIGGVDLEVGDRLLQIGEIDLRGAGYFGFEALALEAGGVRGRAPLVYARDGQRYETELVNLPYPVPWMRLPLLLGCAIVGLIVLLRSPGTLMSQLFFAAMLSLAIFETPFAGGSRWQSYASLLTFNIGGAIALTLAIRCAIEFPPEVPEEKRPSPHWAWLGVLWAVPRLFYFLGGPVPTESIPRIALAFDAFVISLIVGLLSWNAIHAGPVGRRRSKWVVWSAFVASVPTLVAATLSATQAAGLPFHRSLPVGMLSATALPLGIMVGIVRVNLFDINRLLSATAAFSLAAAVLLASLIAVVPPVADAISTGLGTSRSGTQLVLAVALALVAVPAVQRMRPHIDHVFFPDRVLREEGFRNLLRDLSHCATPHELLALITERLSVVLGTQSTVAFVRDGEVFAATASRVVAGETSAAGTIRFDAHGELALAMESNPAPLPIEDKELERRVPGLPRDERARIADSAAQVLLPIRWGKDLHAFLALGARRSGDLYTATDLTLLSAVAEKAGAELLRLTDADSLARERERGRELEALKEEAEQANLSKSRFLAAASHDLRQPLHALGLFVSRLEDQVDTPPARDLVQKIEASTEALSTMFTGLLDMSRLDAGAIEPDVKLFEVRPMLERLAAEIEAAAEAKGLAFVCEIEPQVAAVRSDPTLLARIVQNLAANAVRYTPEGQVRLSASVRRTEVCIRVEDTGPGIAESQQREIFEAFVQLGEGDGVGLGLSIVQRLARLLNHELVLDSAPGQGASFSIHVPHVAEVARTASGHHSVGVDLHGNNIVVIDDDLSILESLRAVLSDWGCNVIIASDTADALEGLERRGRPDLILADYRLGDGETGVEAIDRIRDAMPGTEASAPEIPAIVITGEATPAVSEELRKRDLLHLSKPVAPIKLRATLIEVLRGSS